MNCFFYVRLSMGTVSRNDITSVSGKVNNLCSGCTEILGPLLTTRITKTLNVYSYPMP